MRWETARRSLDTTRHPKRKDPGPLRTCSGRSGATRLSSPKSSPYHRSGPPSPPVHARSRSLARSLASRATKINLATCESQVSLCSGDIEANSVWPSKSADSRSQRYMLLPVSSFSFILTFFGFQFGQRSDVANILLPNWPDPAFHLNQFTAGGYADHPGANF
jgi:hypothetical protein